MDKAAMRNKFRYLIPQLLTSVRVVLGGIALFQAILGQGQWAATWITYGALTDGLDGIAARHLKATSDFGALFDLYADFVCYIVAPVALSLSYFDSAPDNWMLFLLGLPLLAGAIRYARNLGWSRLESFELTGTPGLPTLIYAFLIVTLVFARPEEWIGTSWIRLILLILVPILSWLMISPIRYSKLMKYHWIFYPVTVGFLIMPFVFTRLFATIALALGFVYTVVSPIVVCIRNEGIREAAKFEPGWNLSEDRHAH